LVGVLAVPQVQDPIETEGQKRGEVGPGVPIRLPDLPDGLKVLADGPVVPGRVEEGLDRQPPPNVLGHVLHQVEVFQDLRIIAGVGQDDDPLEVLGRRPQEGDAADVDVLQGVLERHVRRGDDLSKGVQVHGHQVDDRHVRSGRFRLG